MLSHKWFVWIVYYPILPQFFITYILHPRNDRISFVNERKFNTNARCAPEFPCTHGWLTISTIVVSVLNNWALMQTSYMLEASLITTISPIQGFCPLGTVLPDSSPADNHLTCLLMLSGTQTSMCMYAWLFDKRKTHSDSWPVHLAKI